MEGIMRTRHPIVIAAASLICLVAASTNASAQFNQYVMPVERGILDSHIELQYQYSRFEILDSALNVSILSVEAQYAWADRLEVGLNLPFLQHAFTSGGSDSSNDTEFGNMILNLKGRLFGLGDTFALSLYANTLLPTASGVDDRSYAMLQTGAAATADLLGALVGGSIQGIWNIIGNDVEDRAYIGVDAYGGYSLLGVLTFKLAFQYTKSVKMPGDGSVSALAVTPGVEVDILDVIYAGLASRIAINDDAKALYLGRASLLFHGGISF
jgi:hypothetical protein